MLCRHKIFFYIAKGSQGHVLGQNGPLWPTWNTPKKCFLLRKRPKEDERVAQCHFHERVTESPRSHGHFVLSGPIVSFRSYGRLKKKKCRYKQISFTKSLLLLKGHFQSSFIFPFQCSITHVRGYTVVGSVYYLYQRSLSLSLMVPERIGNSANVLKPGNK